jgi:hypothetical protein
MLDAETLGRRLARLDATELEEALTDYLTGQADPVACALAVELVRRARDGERALDAYASLLAQERRSA